MVLVYHHLHMMEFLFRPEQCIRDIEKMQQNQRMLTNSSETYKLDWETEKKDKHRSWAYGFYGLFRTADTRLKTG